MGREKKGKERRKKGEMRRRRRKGEGRRNRRKRIKEKGIKQGEMRKLRNKIDREEEEE